MKFIYYILFIFCLIQSLNAEVKLPVLLSGGIVLQRDVSVKI
jgi:NAD(P)H-dependent flavin oxidoreductase YrpB (nitropropane dioxygenase family)